LVITDFDISFIVPSCFGVVAGRAFESCSLVTIVAGRAVAAVIAVAFGREVCPWWGSSVNNSIKTTFANSNYFASLFVAAVNTCNCFQLINPKPSNFI